MSRGESSAQLTIPLAGKTGAPIRTCSLTLPGRTCNDPYPAWRSFGNFHQAALENGDSRVFIGFHFRDAVEKGLAEGRDIGRWTVGNILSPIER